MEFFKIKEEDLNLYKPLTTAFMIVRSEKGYMLTQDRESGFWELPAGEIEPGESAMECAIRKCIEKSGQSQLAGVRFVGLCKMTFEKNIHRPCPKSVYLAIYTSELNQEFILSDERNKILWYKKGQDISPFCRTSAALIRYYESICE